jgi:apolipoprotein N-acyltransferase
MIVYEFLTSQMGSGTWGNIAYTQTESLALMQLASVTGIWGISFLVYWFNALVVWAASQPKQWSALRAPALVFTTTMTGVLLFGTLRINPATTTPANTVRVAGITGLNLEPLGQVYKDAFGKNLVFDPSTLTQTSPELVEINKGLVEFVADPMSDRFAGSRKAFEDYHDKMFSLAAREALAGSKIISFSEALLFTVKPEEDKLISKGRDFAREHRVYLVLTMGSFIPGKIEFGSKYIENKAVIISPDGNVLTTFFKNKPVPLVEGSVPGDGSIPVIKTDYGKIAPSICYDADFPGLMRKAGQQQVDLMVLPSGDWREISPYHSHMARVRAIENGMSLLRPVSGATSIACDPYGRVINSRSFTDPGEKVLVSYLSTEGVFSLYPILGDWLVLLGFVWIAGLSAHSVWRWVATRGRSATPSVQGI